MARGDAARVAEHRAAGSRARHAGHRGGDHRRGVVVVSWSRPTTARSILGIDAELRTTISVAGTLAGGVSGPGDFPLRAVVQFGWRWLARRARSAWQAMIALIRALLTAVLLFPVLLFGASAFACDVTQRAVVPLTIVGTSVLVPVAVNGIEGI